MTAREPRVSPGSSPPEAHPAVEALATDRALVVVRASTLPDAAELTAALTAGGLRIVEFTFTTPDLPRHLRRASDTSAETGAIVGAGTVRTADQARAAADAGARFLVTPGLRPEVAEAAHDLGLPVLLGAFTPSEVLTAQDLGAAAVKVFPANRLGPRYVRDLAGPLPTTPLVPSGGVTARDAAAYLAAGAFAVAAGTDVAPAEAIAAGDWPALTRRAAEFVRALRARPATPDHPTPEAVA